MAHEHGCESNEPDEAAVRAMDGRVQRLLVGCLAAMDEQGRAKCALIDRAADPPGMRIRIDPDDPARAQVLYGGAVIGSALWSWLATGALD